MQNQTVPDAGSPAELGSLEKLQSELFPGEKLLWHGRPVQGMRFQRANTVGYIFGALLVVVVLVLVLLVLDVIPMPDYWKDYRDRTPFAQATVACCCWIVLISPLAAYCLGWGQWIDARIRRRAFYGVTNERILILRGLLYNSESLTSMRLQDVPHLRLVVSEDGVGTLSFVAQSRGNSNQGAATLPSFYLIPDVRKVYMLIRSIQRGEG